MVLSIFEELKKEIPKNHFTVGIDDDVTHMSLEYNKHFSLESQHKFRGLFFGLGADGTVSVNKNSIKIIGEKHRSMSRVILCTTLKIRFAYRFTFTFW